MHGWMADGFAGSRKSHAAKRVVNPRTIVAKLMASGIGIDTFLIDCGGYAGRKFSAKTGKLTSYQMPTECFRHVRRYALRKGPRSR
jgi:hypothetical protein